MQLPVVEPVRDNGLKSSENLNVSAKASLSSWTAIDNSPAAINQIQYKKQLSHSEAVWRDFHAVGFLSSSPLQ
jgi:hypothetical protein